MATGPAEYCLLWMPWDFVCMPRSDWASWVQAAGSIAAIVGAFHIGERAAERAAQAEVQRARDVRMQRISSLREVLRPILTHLTSMLATLNTTGATVEHRASQMMLDHATRLKAIDLIEFPTGLVTYVVELPEVLTRVAEKWERLCRRGSAKDIQEAKDQLEIAVRNTTNTTMVCEQLIRARE